MSLVPEPPAPPVGSFMQRNAVDPCLQARLAVEMLHSPEHFQKHFLCRVGRVGGIVHHSINEAVDGLVKFTNKPGVRIFRTRLQFLYNGGFLASGPDSACEIAQCRSSRHDPHGSTLIIESSQPDSGVLLSRSQNPLYPALVT